jgi:hypothetical protein
LQQVIIYPNGFGVFPETVWIIGTRRYKIASQVCTKQIQHPCGSRRTATMHAQN